MNCNGDATPTSIISIDDFENYAEHCEGCFEFPWACGPPSLLTELIDPVHRLGFIPCSSSKYCFKPFSRRVLEIVTMTKALCTSQFPRERKSVDVIPKPGISNTSTRGPATEVQWWH